MAKTEILFTSKLSEIICSRIKTLRLEKKKEGVTTLKEFGDLYGLGEPYMKGIMRTSFAPSHDVLAKIAKKENISVDWFYGLSSRRTPIKK